MSITSSIANSVLARFGVRLVRANSLERPSVEAPWAKHDLDLYADFYDARSIRERRFYNIGAGGWAHPAWTNVDNPSDWYETAQGQGGIGLSWDLLALRPLDLEPECAELVYTSHVVEHITDEADENLFREAHRILKPGGAFRILCPDIGEALAALQRNDRHWFNWIARYSRPDEMKRTHIDMPVREAELEQVFLYLVAGSVSELHADGAARRFSSEEVREAFATIPMEEALDSFCSQCPLDTQKKYPGNHINWFTTEKLIRMLTAAGFSSVYPSAYGKSRVPVMRNVLYFDYRRPTASIYVEAIK